METPAHRRLKLLATAFLRERGCRAVAEEVSSPIARYRVDVAGYVDTRVGRGPALDSHRPPAPTDRPRRCEPRTVLVECKQSRADFLRDRRDRDRLIREREDLERRRTALEESLVKRVEPHLRRVGSSLFPDLEEWDFGESRMPAYRATVRRLRRLDALIHGETKFCMIARYALADRLYIAAPRGLVEPREIPPGWGLLECSKRALKGDDPNADLFGESVLSIRVRSPEHSPREVHRQRLLRNIAVSASAAASGAKGLMA